MRRRKLTFQRNRRWARMRHAHRLRPGRPVLVSLPVLLLPRPRASTLWPIRPRPITIRWPLPGPKPQRGARLQLVPMPQPRRRLRRPKPNPMRMPMPPRKPCGPPPRFPHPQYQSRLPRYMPRTPVRRLDQSRSIPILPTRSTILTLTQKTSCIPPGFGAQTCR